MHDRVHSFTLENTTYTHLIGPAFHPVYKQMETFIIQFCTCGWQNGHSQSNQCSRMVRAPAIFMCHCDRYSHGFIKRTVYSAGGELPFIPMKVVQWCMKPKWLDCRVIKYLDLSEIFCIHWAHRASAVAFPLTAPPSPWSGAHSHEQRKRNDSGFCY